MTSLIVLLMTNFLEESRREGGEGRRKEKGEGGGDRGEGRGQRKVVMQETRGEERSIVHIQLC